MKKISLSVLILWVAIGVSLSAIYIPILSDSQELLTNTLNSATGNGLGNTGEYTLSPLVSLLQGKIGSDNDGTSTSTNSGKSLISQQNSVNIPTISPPTIIIPIITPPTTNTNPPEPTIPDTDPTINPPALISTILTPTTVISTTDTTPRFSFRMRRSFTQTTNSGNKYLANNFNMNSENFTIEITNQQDGVTGDGYYEIKTDTEANHEDVLQSGTFPQSNGIVVMNGNLAFTPEDNTEYHILVYTNYPEEDNRVSKADTVYTDPENDDSKGQPNT
ncbi:MAG: hypothetical protein LUQ70_04710 [Methanobacteriaceae archaeon]|nr:hypothetical protein [Methanobacteriaceae archaeon]